MKSLYLSFISLVRQWWMWLHQHLRMRAIGQGLVEYALILVLIAVVVIGILGTVGNRTSSLFSEISCSLDGGPTHTDNGQGKSNRCK